MTDPLRVLFVASEAVPFAKTGGLADVAGALPKFLPSLGCDVRVVMPYYRMVERSGLPVRPLGESLDVPVGDAIIRADLYEGRLTPEIPVYFIGQKAFYDRDGLYGTPAGDYPDNAERFVLLTRASLLLCRRLGFSPQIIHQHDWQTGLLPAYLRTVYRNDPFFARAATVFTIHNIAYQGLFDAQKLALTGLPPELYNPEGIEFWGKINFLKAGITYSDVINTVSRKYSQEIQTVEFGCGLEGVLNKRKDDLFGILNGVDYDEWNPAGDPHLAARYTSADLAGKRACKEDLLREFGLPPSLAGKPLLGMISRLADQKGFDLLAEILDELFALDIGFVLLGTGDKKYNDLMARVARTYPGQAGIRIAYDNRIAHKIEAGADLFLMPSRYEPCGLNQIYSLRYGTLPVVRATGGLEDTIVDYNPATGKGNGFKFEPYRAEAFLDCIRKALALFRRPETWKQLVINAMAADFSWPRSAEAYFRLYGQALERMKRRP
jgi:starch synthase